MFQKSKILIFLSFSFLSVIISGVVFFSYRDQSPLITEYNSNTFNLSLDFIDNLNTSFPNISVTTIPLDGIKAMYYFKSSKFDSAIYIAKKGSNSNPFIGFNDAIISDSFLSLGQVDSALYYARRAYNKLPNNIIHQDVLLRSLEKKQNLDEIIQIFLKHKDTKERILYYRYLSAKITFNSIDYNEDLVYAKEAVNFFPENKEFQVIFQLIKNGVNAVNNANFFSELASTSYGQNDFEDALYNYKKAEELIPDEPAYKENIGTCYLKLKQYNNALKYYNIVIDSLNPLTGRPEYLKGYVYVELKNRLLACESFEASARLNNQTGKQLFSQYCN